MTTLNLRNTWLSPFAEFDARFRPLANDVARVGFTPAAEVNRDGEDALVRGERRDERADERGGRRIREVRYGSFRRTFSLPAHITGDDLTATYDKGVLTVRVTGAYRGSTAHRVPVTAGTATAVVEGAK